MTTPSQFRLPDDTRAKVEALAARWGGLSPATRTAVVIEAIDRAYAQEFGGEATRRPAKPKGKPKP